MNRRRLIAGVSMAVVLAGCGRTLDVASLEKDILEGLQRQTSATVTEVSCPQDVTPQQGDVFVCRAAVADGSTAVVTVTQEDAKGRLTWEVTDVVK